MKLKQYVSSEETSYAELASKVGSISSVSIYRYAAGLRNPTLDVVKRITRATGGKVTAKDFDKIQEQTVKKREIKRKTTSQKWLDQLKNWHLNGSLECEFSFDDLSSDEGGISLPIAVALRELKERATFNKGRYFLDGRPSAIAALIEAANASRKRRGLVKIIYPGCL